MHNMRKHRTGTTDLPTKRTDPYLAGQGYLIERGGGFTHRRVLYDKIGYGPHWCYHCGCHVNWLTRKRTEPWPVGMLTVDHLDADKTNNAYENLVPACIKCNAGRRRSPA